MDGAAAAAAAVPSQALGPGAFGRCPVATYIHGGRPTPSSTSASPPEALGPRRQGRSTHTGHIRVNIEHMPASLHGRLKVYGFGEAFGLPALASSTSSTPASQAAFRPLEA